MLSIFTLVAGLALSPGEELWLEVPDISYFPDAPQTRLFTLAKISSNAYWLVQDTTWFDLPSPEDEFQLVWQNLITAEDIDSMASEFEGASGMFSVVTAAFGEMPETVNGDDRIWIVFADIPDYYPVPGSGYQRLRNWLYTWPFDFDGDPGTGNDHDIFYVNIGPYKNQTGGPWNWDEIRQSIHTWSVASGLGQIIRMAANPNEEKWVIRGLGAYTQYLCFGITSDLNGSIGIEGYMTDFAKAGGVELPSWWSGMYSKDFSANLGGEFLWFQYLAQRIGSGVIEAIAQSDLTGMEAIALAIDPSVPLELSKELITYPLYEDWIITNLISPFAENYQNGDYHYKFLDGSGYEFSIVDQPASFLGEFDEYPFPTWIAPVTYGISAQEFAAQYADFQSGYGQGNSTVHFNGMFNQNDGSGANIDGKWTVFRIVLEDSSLASVDSLVFDDMYNGTFELYGDRTFLAIMCNNQGGTANIRYALSQDAPAKSVFTSFTQNPMNAGLFQIYTSLYRDDSNIPYGFDWVGPLVTMSLLNSSGIPDSTSTVDMQFLAQTIWSGSIATWGEGYYRLVSSGFDSLGRQWGDTLACCVAFSGQDSLLLSAGSASYALDGKSLPSRAVVSLVETDIPMGAEQSPVRLAGPVSVSTGGGLLQFTSDETNCAVYLNTGDDWTEIDCYRVGLCVSALIADPGIYMLGETGLDPPPEVCPTPCFCSVSPNPFASELSFSFSTPRPGHVDIDLYDLCGRVSASLFDGSVNGGVMDCCWSGTLPSGVYFAVLQSDSAIDVRRLVKL